MPRLGESQEAVLNETVDRVLGEAAIVASDPSRAAGQDFDALVDGISTP